MLGASAERRRPSAIMSSVVFAWDSAETGRPSQSSADLDHVALEVGELAAGARVQRRVGGDAGEAAPGQGLADLVQVGGVDEELHVSPFRLASHCPRGAVAPLPKRRYHPAPAFPGQTGHDMQGFARHRQRGTRRLAGRGALHLPDDLDDLRRAGRTLQRPRKPGARSSSTSACSAPRWPSLSVAASGKRKRTGSFSALPKGTGLASVTTPSAGLSAPLSGRAWGSATWGAIDDVGAQHVHAPHDVVDVARGGHPQLHQGLPRPSSRRPPSPRPRRRDESDPRRAGHSACVPPPSHASTPGRR